MGSYNQPVWVKLKKVSPIRTMPMFVTFRARVEETWGTTPVLLAVMDAGLVLLATINQELK
jgi:hypothetical protein